MSYGFTLVTLFPQLVREALAWGVIARAHTEGLIHVQTVNPRDHAQDKHRSVDDEVYGGGPGMLLQAPVCAAALADARARSPAGSPLIALTPEGDTLTQARVAELAAGPGVILFAGRYEGFDQRLLDREVDAMLSIGDYVVSGGELPALVVLDAIARSLPGVLGNEKSAVSESHLDGLLDYPQYTRPEIYRQARVPPVLLSGDHRAIAAWRRQQALLRTYQRRPDLLAHRRLSPQERDDLRAALEEQDQLRAAERAHKPD